MATYFEVFKVLVWKFIAIKIPILNKIKNVFPCKVLSIFVGSSLEPDPTKIPGSESPTMLLKGHTF
jgi:hypothetical protein